MAKPLGRPAVPFDNRLRKTEAGCWEWTGTIVRGGYGQVSRSGKMVYAHRVAFERAKGFIPEGLSVCHSCDNPACCNPSHLFLGTHVENIQDKVNKGRQVRHVGSKNPAAKLTPHAVQQIRKLCAEGTRQKDVAALFGVTQANVSLIVLRKKWPSIS